jgi:hypothetical protein
VAIQILLTGCFASEQWVIPVTYAEYTWPEELSPYIITEEEWPPIKLDVEMLTAIYDRMNKPVTVEVVEEMKDRLETQSIVDALGASNEEMGLLFQSCPEQLGYNLIILQNETNAPLRYSILLDNTLRAEGRGMINHTQYPLGDDAEIYWYFEEYNKTIHGRKFLIARYNQYIFEIFTYVNFRQPDPNLAEKMAEIVAEKIQINETGSFMILLSLFLLKQDPFKKWIIG